MTDLTQVRALLLDYGGTLDTDAMHWAHVIAQGYQAVGVRVDADSFRQAYVHGERELARHRIIMPDDDFGVLLRKKMRLQADWLLAHGAWPAAVPDAYTAAADIAGYCYRYAAAQTAQSAADTANTGIEALNAKFPVKRNDIATDAINSSKIESYSITLNKLVTDRSNIYLDSTSLSYLRFPETGSATLAQISDGVIRTSNHFLNNLRTDFLQVKISILESGSNSTVFKCESNPVVILNKKTNGTIAMLPFIIFNDSTNEIYDGIVKISMEIVSQTKHVTCKVIFKTEPPFNDNTEFVINVYPIYTQLSQTTP